MAFCIPAFCFTHDIEKFHRCCSDVTGLTKVNTVAASGLKQIGVTCKFNSIPILPSEICHHNKRFDQRMPEGDS